MKALTLLQPWASLVALGGHPDPDAQAMAKRIETRSWRTNYRGPLVIHSSKNPPKGWPANWPYICGREPFARAIAKAVNFQGDYWNVFSGVLANALPRGKFLCTCDLIDCVPITTDNRPPEPERSFGDYSTEPKQRYAWHIANVKTLPAPIPAKGMQGLWTPEPDALAALNLLHSEGMVEQWMSSRE